MKTNKRAGSGRFDPKVRLAGGFGMMAAVQDPEALLRRSVLANLLWEKNAYEDGVSIADNIKALIPQVPPHIVYQIAVEARTVQKLRHVPLLLAVEMARRPKYRHFLDILLPKIILRPDELTEFMALYWQDGKVPIANRVKTGLALAFHNFDEYQFAKWSRDTEIKIRDVMFMVHPVPPQGQEDLYKRIADDELRTPDTWEVALSGGANKKATWTRLIQQHKLGANAFMQNLRNMESVGVNHDVIKYGFNTINPRWLLPINFIAAAKAAPRWEREIEELMYRSLEKAPLLPGHTVMIVDVSGSMGCKLSDKSMFNRMQVAEAMTMMAAEMCEEISIYATAGSDMRTKHATKFVPPRRGFALMDEIDNMAHHLGGGGIFTRQCLEYIRDDLKGRVTDRIVIFSDSQDCDRINRVPSPFGNTNYIIDVSSHTRGINYKGIWTAEISGWSEHFLKYIAALEGLNLPEVDEEQ